jgi:hypothetical protein
VRGEIQGEAMGDWPESEGGGARAMA